MSLYRYMRLCIEHHLKSNLLDFGVYYARVFLIRYSRNPKIFPYCLKDSCIYSSFIYKPLISVLRKFKELLSFGRVNLFL